MKFSELVINNHVFEAGVDVKTIITRLIEKGFLPGLSLNDIEEINEDKLMKKIDDLLSTIGDDTLIAFGYRNILGVSPKSISEHTGMTLVSQRVSIPTDKLKSKFWKTEDIRLSKFSPDVTISRLWLEPDLLEMVINNNHIYKTVRELANIIACAKIYHYKENPYFTRMEKMISNIYPVQYSLYPWNLIAAAVDGMDFFSDDLEIIGTDTTDIELFIQRSIRQIRDIDILDKRFIDHMTLTEIANEYNLTPDRIRQIEARALRTIVYGEHKNKLRHLVEKNSTRLGRRVYENIYNMRYLDDNLCDVETVEFLIHILGIDTRQSVEEISNAIIADKRALMILKYGVLRTQEISLDVDGKIPEFTEDTDIDLIDLSVRTFNSLKCGGIRTIGDILSTAPEDIMKIRNLGRKSYKEFIDKLNKLGFDVSRYYDILSQQ